MIEEEELSILIKDFICIEDTVYYKLEIRYKAEESSFIKFSARYSELL